MASTSPAAAADTALDLFDRSAERWPDRVALVAGDAVFTYDALRRRANARARQLRALGCAEGDVVGVCLERSFDLIASLLAVWKAGATFLPLDPLLPEERSRSAVEAARAWGVLAQGRAGDAFRAGRTRVVDVAAPIPDGGRTTLRAPDPACPAYVIFTSGSTGRPKGVAVSHGAFAGYVRWAAEAYRFDRQGVSVVHTSVGVDLTLTSIFCPLILGMRTVLVPDADGPEGLARWLDKRRAPVSLLKMTPSHLSLLNEWPGGDGTRWDCDVLILGGEALDAADVRRFRRRSPGVRAFNEYGPTEATVGCSLYAVAETAADGPVPIGSAVAQATLAVGDPFASAESVEGELSIGGGCLAIGYLRDPSATAEKFVPDVRAAGARVYRSGDRVRHLAGDAGLAFLGRLDRQVKLRGFRVELGEIESCLAAYPGIRAAAVLAGPAERGGETTVTAFLAVSDRDRAGLERSALERHLRERLVPAAVPAEFHLLGELPLAASGKVDLARLLREGPDHPRLTGGFRPPRNPTEELLASLWRRVLGVEEVGIDDSFFALDGNSMKSIQLAHLAKKAGLELTTRLLFEHPTIRELGAILDAGRVSEDAEPAGGAFALVSARDRARMPEDVEDAYPLALLQAGTLFESGWSPESGTYHNVNSYQLEGRLDRDRLRASLDLLARRHPILRTSYDFATFEEPLQLVRREAAIPLFFERLPDAAPAVQDEELARFIQAESRTAFDWTRPPLLRFFVHERGGGRFQLTLSKHHSILDGWSAATLIAELLGNYLALGRAAVLPFTEPVGTRYGSFVALERAALARPEAADFWRRSLHGVPARPLQPWPGRKPRPTGGCSSATFRVVPLPEGTSLRLKRVAALAGTPLKSVLLAVHLRVLSRMAGEQDVVTGVVSHGRPETSDADRALGLFINTLPHRARVEPAAAWLDLVRSVFQEERRAFPYRRYAMARIKRDLGAAPFDSIFYFTDFHVFRGLKDADGIRCVGSAGFEETEIPFTSAFSLHPLTGGLSLRLHFHVERFSEEQIETVAGWFRQALDAIAERPEDAMGACALDPPAIPDAAGEGAAGPDAQDVFAAFVEQARAHADRQALVSPHGHVSYGALLSRVERLAAELAARGAGPGTAVVVGLPVAWEAVTALLAVAATGACCVMLDRHWPDERLRELIDGVEPVALVADETFSARGLLAPERTVGPRAQGERRMPTYPPAGSLAYGIFTSGSTGRPKGVMVSRTGLALSTASRLGYYADTPYERFLLLSRLTFDSAYAGLWGTLAAGGTLLLPDDDARLDVGTVVETIAGEAVTHYLAVPSLHRALLLELPGRAAALRSVIVAGEEVASDLVAAHHRALPGVRLFNEYGPSEVTVWSTVAELPDGVERTGDAVPIGRGVAHVVTRVLSERSVPVGAGETGELYLGGPAVARGYLRAPAATAERFLPDPFASVPGAVLYRSGDLVRAAPDGELAFVGRTDNQLKVRGFRIEPEEVEAAFHRLYPGRDALVRARGGVGAAVGLGLYFAAGADDVLAPAAVREALARVLPAHTVPDAVVAVEDLPRTANGKLDRRAVLVPVEPAREASDRAPASDLERALALLWMEALAVPELGAGQSFFELGGDSLLANRIVLKADRVFGVRLRLKEFYEMPTVAAQAALISRRAQSLGIDVERVAALWNQLE